MRPSQNLDLSQCPPPDLAIECDLTSQTVIRAYEAIQVPEVWIDAKDHLKIYLYSDPGRHSIYPRAATYPALGHLNELTNFLGYSLPVAIASWVDESLGAE